MAKTLKFKKVMSGLAILGAAGSSIAQPTESPGNTAPLSKPPSATRPAPPVDNPLEEAMFPFAGKPLRDPFWPVGYFPTEWGKKEKPEEQKFSTSAWRAPAARLQVRGVSRMGDRVMAFINGELYSPGDVVEVLHHGKAFQWKVAEIKPDGKVQFDRYKIISDTSR